MAEIRVGGHVIGEHGWELAPESVTIGYDPADHTVAEVKDHVGDDPEAAQEILELEKDGKNRVTLVEALEAVINGEGSD